MRLLCPSPPPGMPLGGVGMPDCMPSGFKPTPLGGMSSPFCTTVRYSTVATWQRGYAGLLVGCVPVLPGDSMAHRVSSPLCVCFPAPTLAAWVPLSGRGMYPRAGTLWHGFTTSQQWQKHTGLPACSALLYVTWQCGTPAVSRRVVCVLLFACRLSPSTASR